MAVNKTFTQSGVIDGNTITYSVKVSEISVNNQTNVHTLQIQTTLKQTWNGDLFDMWGTGVQATINGEDIINSYKQRELKGTSEHIYETATTTVMGENDGTCKITVGGKIWQNDPTWFFADGLIISNQTLELTTVDRSGGTSSFRVTRKTHDSITISYNSTVLTTLIQYRLNNGSWVDAGVDLPNSGGGETSFTINRLSPNTTYTIECRHRRDYNNVYSNISSASIITNKPEAPIVGMPTVENITYNSARILLGTSTAGSGASISKYQISTNNVDWTDVTYPYTVSGLNPNTSYTRYVRCVDNYGTASASENVTFTTAKPVAPTRGTISVSNILPFTVDVKINGFSLGAGATSGTYRYRLNDGNWISNITSTSFTINKLNEETAYTLEVQMVDNYNTPSSSASTTFITPTDQAKVFYKDNEIYLIYRVWFKKNDGTWVKVKKMYFKITPFVWKRTKLKFE